MELLGDPITISYGKSQLKEFFTKLWQLKNGGTMVDSELETDDGVVYPVHKLILVASSEYFANESIDPNLKKFLIPGVQNSIVQMIIDYIYSQEVMVPIDVVWDLYDAASKFSFKSLADQCSQCITSNLGVANCLHIYKICRQRRLHNLQEHVTEYIAKNFDKVDINNEYLMNLTSDELSSLLVDDRLTCKEEHLWFVVKTWLEKKPEMRKESAAELLSCLRLGFLDASFVFENIMRHPFVFSDEQCRGIVSERLELLWDLAEMMSMKHVQTKYIAKPRLPKDLLFSVGGHEEAAEEHSGIIQVYDNKADVWCDIAEDLDTTDATKRCGHACVVLEHCLYVIGGQDVRAGAVLNTVACLDLVAKQWTAMPRMIKPRYGMCAVVVGNKIIVMGGSQGSNSLYSVEACDTSHTTSKSWSFLNCMKKSRCWASAAVLNGLVYVTGGTSNHSNVLKSAEVFNPENCSWTVIANMKEQRLGLSCTAYNGFLYVAGGSGQASVERYNPETNCWTVISQLREPRCHFSLVVLDSALYAIGGIRDSDVLSSSGEVYNEELRTWRAITMDGHRLKMSAACVARSLPNVSDYLYKNRDDVLELKRKLIYTQRLKSATHAIVENASSCADEIE